METSAQPTIAVGDRVKVVKLEEKPFGDWRFDEPYLANREVGQQGEVIMVESFYVEVRHCDWTVAVYALTELEVVGEPRGA